MGGQPQNSAWTRKTRVLCFGMGTAPADATYSVTASPGQILFYDGNGDAKMPAGVKSHMNCDIGLAWLRLPLVPPTEAM